MLQFKIIIMLVGLRPEPYFFDINFYLFEGGWSLGGLRYVTLVQDSVIEVGA